MAVDNIRIAELAASSGKENVANEVMILISK